MSCGRGSNGLAPPADSPPDVATLRDVTPMPNRNTVDFDGELA